MGEGSRPAARPHVEIVTVCPSQPYDERTRLRSRAAAVLCVGLVLKLQTTIPVFIAVQVKILEVESIKLQERAVSTVEVRSTRPWPAIPV